MSIQDQVRKLDEEIAAQNAVVETARGNEQRTRLAHDSARCTLNTEGNKLRDLHEQRRQLAPACHFCDAKALVCEDMSLPSGWTREDLPSHEGNELVFNEVAVCPNGHSEEIESQRKFHLEEYDN